MKSKIKTRIKTILTCIVMLFISYLSFIYIQGRDQSDKKVDYVIVLGARLFGEDLSLTLYNRLNTALDYLEKNKNTKVIVSGGQGYGEDIPEAHAMSRYLISKGIREDRIIIEDKSLNTLQNLKNSYELARVEKPESDISVLIATNRYHVFRGKFLAERVGFKAYGLPAPTPKIVLIKSYLREMAAIVKSAVFDY